MSKTKFTKGDWSVEDGRVVVCGDFKVAYSYSGANVPFMEHVKANANLIACAPDMYEMLERVMCNYQVLASIAGQNGIVFDEYAQDSKDTESLLKRARGEQ